MVAGLSTEPLELEHLITRKTAECEGIELWGAHFNKIVAARVIDVQPLPNGKNNRVEIEAGTLGRHVVVCGAPTVKAGMIAAWVPPGTELFGKTIGLATIDGIESAGMLASA